MAKTFDALRRAAEEKGLRAEIPPVTAPSGERESSLTPFEKSPPMKMPPRLPGLRKLKSFSQTVEEFQRMKHNILHSDPTLLMKSILFCSSRRREGTSTVLIHFAQTLASEGNRVLLVDGNLRDPSLHEAFHLPIENGLAELIVSRDSLRDMNRFLKETTLENLWVMTSGKAHPYPASILGSGYFDMLIEQLKAQWDWVLFDCSPVTSSSDSVALAAKMDGIILVVQAEKTRWEVVKEVQGWLEHGGGRILGVVLNKSRFHIPR